MRKRTSAMTKEKVMQRAAREAVETPLSIA